MHFFINNLFVEHRKIHDEKIALKKFNAINSKQTVHTNLSI